MKFLTPLAIAAFAATLAGPAFALGATPVTVTNPGDIAKAAGIQRPFQLTLSCPSNAYGNGCFTAFTQGAQRLVIEYVSVRCEQIVGQAVTALEVGTSVGGAGATHELTIGDRIGSQGYYGSGTREVNVGRKVRLYADANTQVSVSSTFAGNSGTPGYPFCVYTLSGQQVDVP